MDTFALIAMIANIAQIFSWVWLLIFGSNTALQVIRLIRFLPARRRRIRSILFLTLFRKSNWLNVVLTVLIILLSTVILRMNEGYTHQKNVSGMPSSITPTSIAVSYPPAGWRLIINDPLKNNSNGYGWSEQSLCGFSSDGYHAIALKPAVHPCLATETNVNDFACELQMTLVKGDQGGILLRANSQGSSYYYFHISWEGTYAFDVYTAYTHTTNPGFSPLIHNGLGASNVLAVVAHGNTFELSINHQLVDIVTDPDKNFASGELGVAAQDNDGQTDARFSNLKVWIPDQKALS